MKNGENDKMNGTTNGRDFFSFSFFSLLYASDGCNEFYTSHNCMLYVAHVLPKRFDSIFTLNAQCLFGQCVRQEEN